MFVCNCIKFLFVITIFICFIWSLYFLIFPLINKKLYIDQKIHRDNLYYLVTTILLLLILSIQCPLPIIS